MAREVKIFQTENHAYEVTQLAADKEGRGALLRAQKLAVKAQGGIESLVTDMTEDDLDYFCQLFGRYTKVVLQDKKPQLGPMLSVHFSGGEGWFEMTKWLAFCLGLNFGPFFVSLMKNGAEVRAAALAGAGIDPSESSPQTGLSGESSLPTD